MSVVLSPPQCVKSSQLRWRSGTRSYHLGMPDLQMSGRNSMTWQNTRPVAPSIANWRYAPNTHLSKNFFNISFQINQAGRQMLRTGFALKLTDTQNPDSENSWMQITAPQRRFLYMESATNKPLVCPRRQPKSAFDMLRHRYSVIPLSHGKGMMNSQHSAVEYNTILNIMQQQKCQNLTTLWT